jgi:aspartate aminotransferase
MSTDAKAAAGSRRVRLSHRAEIAPASPIRKLEPFARRATERGVKIYHLNIGQPDIPTPHEFLQHARLEDGQVLAYSPSGGLYPYRQALARYYAGFGAPVTEADVLVTTGGSEALLFALMALCDPGDEVITPEPHYPNYATFAIMAGATLRGLPTRIEDGFRLPGPEVFAAAVTERTRAILLCNPSNPTGAVYSRESLEAVVALCRERGLVLIADEVYREFLYTDDKPGSVLSLPGADEVAVVIDSVSKRFSACGARIGCLVTRLPELMSAATRFAMSRLSPPTLGQLGSLAALADPGPFISSMIGEFCRRRDVLRRGLKALPGVLAPEPQGAFYLMTRLPVDSSERFCEWLLSDFSHDNETVMLAPGPGFYQTPGAGADEVRIAYVLAEEPLRRAVELLGHALERYPGTRRSGPSPGSAE